MPPGDTSQPLRVLGEIRDLLFQVFGLGREMQRQGEQSAQREELHRNAEAQEAAPSAAETESRPGAAPGGRDQTLHDVLNQAGGPFSEVSRLLRLLAGIGDLFAAAFDDPRRQAAGQTAGQPGGQPGASGTPAQGAGFWPTAHNVMGMAGGPFAEISQGLKLLSGLMDLLTHVDTLGDRRRAAGEDAGPTNRPAPLVPVVRRPQQQGVDLYDDPDVIDAEYKVLRRRNRLPDARPELPPMTVPTTPPALPGQVGGGTTQAAPGLPALPPAPGAQPVPTTSPLPIALPGQTAVPTTSPMPIALPGQVVPTGTPMPTAVPLQVPTSQAAQMEAGRRVLGTAESGQSAQQLLEAAQKLLEAAQKLSEAADDQGGDGAENAENWAERSMWNLPGGTDGTGGSQNNDPGNIYDALARPMGEAGKLGGGATGGGGRLAQDVRTLATVGRAAIALGS